MVQVPKFNAQLPSSQPAPVNGANTTAGGAEAAGQAVRTMMDISGSLNQMAQRRAAVEGQQEGARFGAEADRLVLRQDGTVRGEAFDRAATQAYLSKIDVDMRDNMARVARENRGDLDGLNRSLTSLEQGYMATVPDTIQPQMKAQFGRLRLAYEQEELRRQEETTLSSAIAGVKTQIDTRLNDIDRLSSSIEDDEQAAGAVAQELTEMQELLATYGPRGEFELNGQTYKADPARQSAFSPDQIQDVLTAATDRAEEGRVLGKFERADQKAQFLEDFRNDYTAQKPELTQGLSRQQFDRLVNRMEADVRGIATATSKQANALERAINGQIQKLEKGYLVSDGTFDALRSQAQALGPASGEAMKMLDNAQTIAAFSQNIRQLKPSELQGVLNKLQEQQEDPSEAQISMMEITKKLLNEANTELDRDPMSFAARVGLIQPTQISPLPTGDPEQDAANVQALQSRADESEAVADHYDVPVTPLTREEIDQVQRVLETGTADEGVQTLSMLSAGLGDKAIDVFRAMGDKSSLMAYTGGLALESDYHLDTAAMVLRGRQILKEGVVKAPSSSDAQIPIADTFGSAYTESPETEGAIVQAANAIYAAGEISGDRDPIFDQNRYEEALQRAAGQVKINGVRYGGVANVLGEPTPLPSMVSEDEMDGAIENISDLDLELLGNGQPKDSSGRPITANMVRKYGRLVAVGDGKYMVDFDGKRLASGDPDTNGFYVLDLDREAVMDLNSGRLGR